jgi:L-serine dehydratase
LCTALAGEKPQAVRCSFDPKGSYAPTYEALGVDLSFAAGLLGWDMTDPRYHDSLKAVSQAGIDLSFDVAPLEHADHPNSARIEIKSPQGGKLIIWAKSTGGGIVEIYRLNDWPVSIDGKPWEILITARRDSADRLQRLPGEGASVSVQKDGDQCLIQYTFKRQPSDEIVESFSSDSGVSAIWRTDPIFYPQAGEPLFASMKELIAIAEKREWRLGEAGRAYESQLLGLTADEADREMLRRYEVMKSSVQQGLDSDNVNMAFTPASAHRIWRAEEAGSLPLGGPQTRAAVRAMATMHTCNSKGVVCAAPTGGAAGTIPGVLVTLEEEQGLDAQRLADALFAASAVGLIVARRATFAAEIAGCQVEIGVAGAMAAALVVEASGGSARQAADAAAIALQNTMGSVCDPVGGGCEIPCHTRNAAAASSAFLCADLIMGGYPNPIDLDETIDASYAVGQALPRELRCTVLGGIAVTPSAKALVEKALEDSEG